MTHRPLLLFLFPLFLSGRSSCQRKARTIVLTHKAPSSMNMQKFQILREFKTPSVMFCLQALFSPMDQAPCRDPQVSQDRGNRTVPVVSEVQYHPQTQT